MGKACKGLARWVLGLLVLATAAAPAWAQQQGRRVALVVGNAAYGDVPLKNPLNDAEDLRDKLRGLGFQVTLATNRDRSQLIEAVREFGRDAAGAEAALFYFAGHGVQVEGQNYLLPVGRTFTDEEDVASYAVNVDTVLRRMKEAGAKVNLVVLDACRTYPLKRLKRSDEQVRGLAYMGRRSGALVAFAAQPGEVAFPSS